MTPQKDIILTLDPKEVDLIAHALQQLPWIQVNTFIQKLVQQVNNQPKTPGEGEQT